MEAVRHAQAAQDWGLAARLLADHWLGLDLDGQARTVHALLAGFPAELPRGRCGAGGAGAADEMAAGSLEAAERFLEVAARGSGVGAAGPARQLHVLVSWSGCGSPGSGDLPAVAEEAQQLRPWPRPRMRCRPAWARTCARWR